jgi:hypothetical protein
MRGAIPPLPNTPSWRCAQLRNRDRLGLNEEKDIIKMTLKEMRPG